MPVRVNLPETFAARLAAADRPQVGMWVCSGSPIVAEIAAGSGLDWVLIDAEHSPNGLESILGQLYAVSAYPVAPVVRPPIGDVVVIKQYLDLGVQNLLVPMVDSAEQAAELVRAVRYPGGGVRGVGASLARSSRWNRVDDYLHERLGDDQPHRADRVGDRGRRRRRDRRGRRRRRRSSWGPPTSRPRWACSGSRATPMSWPPCCRRSRPAAPRASPWA